MPKTVVYNLNGEKVGEHELNPKIFAVEIKPVVIQQVIVAQQANARKPWANTKTRSEVRGGGKKPWKQKGTGRARHGSSRSPIWRGGGITFGPRKERNYAISINKKMKKVALRMVLSEKVNNNNVIVVDSLELPVIKTKQVAESLAKLPIKGRKTLFLTDQLSRNFIRSSRNIPNIGVLGAGSLNVGDLLKYKNIVIPVQALSTVDKLYS